MNDLLKTLIEKLSPEGAERVALIMADRLGGNMQIALPRLEAMTATLCSTDDSAGQACKEACDRLLAAIAGASKWSGVPTPEETYGSNIGWATGDAIKTIHALTAKLIDIAAPKVQF